MRPNLIPAEWKLKEMPRLHVLVFPMVDGTSVTPLIGAYVPELFCRLAFCKSRRGEPVAIKTPSGLYLLEPSLSLSSTLNCSVDFVSHPYKTIEREIQTIWFGDCKRNTAVLDMPFSREDHLIYKLLKDSIRMVNGSY